jgi:hypothetical protein
MDAETRQQRLASLKRWNRGVQQDLCLYLLLLAAGIGLIGWVNRIELLSQLPDDARTALVALVSVPSSIAKLTSRWRLWRRTLPWLNEIYSGTGPTSDAELVFHDISRELDGRSASSPGGP